MVFNFEGLLWIIKFNLAAIIESVLTINKNSHLILSLSLSLHIYMCVCVCDLVSLWEICYYSSLLLLTKKKYTCFTGYVLSSWVLMFSLSFSVLRWHASLVLLFAVVFRVSLRFCMQLQTRQVIFIGCSCLSFHERWIWFLKCLFLSIRYYIANICRILNTFGRTYSSKRYYPCP
jgi:hypothetical protein